MSQAVYVVGAGRTDFKRNLQTEGASLRDVIVEAGRAAIAGAGLEPRDVQSGVVGNFAAGLFTRQLHLGSFLTDIDPALRGIPTLHTEAACASGGVAVLTAVQQIMAGLHDVVLVVGAEQQKTMSPADGSDVLGAAADYLAEKAAYGEFMFPKLFARIAQLYAERYGLTDRQLSAIAMKNRAHAKLNPLAQTRGSALTWELCFESGDNPRLAPPLKITDCSQITDGAAAILLCSESFAKRLESRPKMRLAGFGHTTDHLALSRKDPPDFPMARRAADAAYTMARLKPRDLSGVEIHDCFSISEIIATEALGLAPPGQGKTLAERGFTVLPRVRESLGLPKPAWSIPVNAGGGLIGDGHPVGATGVRQVQEIFQHLTRRAADRQIAGAKNMLAFNMGGSVTTVVVTIWEGA